MPRKELSTVDSPADELGGASSSVVVDEHATTGEVLTHGGPAMQALVAWLAAKAEGTDDDTYADVERMVQRLLSAEKPEEVLAEETIYHGKEFVDKPFLCHGFRIREGDFEEGAPFYALLDITLEMGQKRRIVSCGGWVVLAALARLDQIGEWPQPMMIRGRLTRKKFTALNLVTPAQSEGEAPF